MLQIQAMSASIQFISATKSISTQVKTSTNLMALFLGFTKAMVKFECT
jgi:hypothetical protein